MSNDLNQCNFIGRLGKDVVTRYMPTGKAVADFSIAVGSQWKNEVGEKKESTEWVQCVAFGKLAEVCSQYLAKGSQVYVGGRMKTETYEKDGQKRYSTKIIVDTMQMLGGKRDDESPQREKPSAPQSKEPATGGDFYDDDIPFAQHMAGTIV